MYNVHWETNCQLSQSHKNKQKITKKRKLVSTRNMRNIFKGSTVGLNRRYIEGENDRYNTDLLLLIPNQEANHFKMMWPMHHVVCLFTRQLLPVHNYITGPTGCKKLA